MAFQTPTDGTDIYKGSFFPQNIRDRNNLPESVNISSEIADECVAKFTSLVRARTQYILGPRWELGTYFLNYRSSWWMTVNYGVLSVNYLDTDLDLAELYQF